MSQSGQPESPEGGDGALPRSSRVQRRFVVIGNFDGVHLGHQAILMRAGREAARLGLSPTVLTFDPHPTFVLSGEERPCLTTLPRKMRLLRALVPGLEVWVESFSVELAQLSPSDFCSQVLSRKLASSVVLVGQNFRFGHRRAGDLSMLRALGETFGFETRIADLVGDERGAFSSTRIRSLLAAGEVEEANQVLGRPHLFSGQVVHGDRRGRELGFPTANLVDIPQVLPKDGVYAVHVYDAENGGRHLGPGVANLGARPTVARPAASEVHVIDRDVALYGKRLAVSVLERLRSVERFASLDALKAQIARDVERAQSVCALLPSPEVPRWW